MCLYCNESDFWTASQVDFIIIVLFITTCTTTLIYPVWWVPCVPRHIHIHVTYYVCLIDDDENYAHVFISKPLRLRSLIKTKYLCRAKLKCLNTYLWTKLIVATNKNVNACRVWLWNGSDFSFFGMFLSVGKEKFDCGDKTWMKGKFFSVCKLLFCKLVCLLIFKRKLKIHDWKKMICCLYF